MNKQRHVARCLRAKLVSGCYVLYNQQYRKILELALYLRSYLGEANVAEMGLSRLAEMLCTLLLLIQIFTPDPATLAADIQTRALVLSCAVFAFVVRGLFRDAYRPAKAYKLGS